MKLLSGENMPANAIKKTMSRFCALVKVEYGMGGARSFCSVSTNSLGSLDVMIPAEPSSRLFSVASMQESDCQNSQRTAEMYRLVLCIRSHSLLASSQSDK